MNANRTKISGSAAPAAAVSGAIAAEGQIIGMMPAAVLTLDEWAISIVPIEGGNRLIARKGTQIQQMDILNGAGIRATDDGDGNIRLS